MANSSGWLASFPKGGGAATPVQFNANGISAIAFDQATGNYTLTAEGTPLTFSPANLVAAKSTSQVNVYETTTPSGSSTLTLTKPGTSGSLTYQYVGGALLRRTVETATGVEGRFNAAIYGIRTADGAVFTGGAARFPIDVLGAYLADSTQGGTVPLSGSGDMVIQFGDGSFSFVVPVSSPSSAPYQLTATGKITSGQNGFFGNVWLYTGAVPYVGSIAGGFFGPAANEVGAHWTSQQANSGSVTVSYASGIVLGRRGAPITQVTSFTGLNVPQAYIATGSHFIQSFGSGSTPGQLRQTEVSVHYDPGTNSYSVILPDSFLDVTSQLGQSYPSGLYDLITASGGTATGRLLTVSTGANGVELTYLRGADWLRQNNNFYGNSFVFGYQTPVTAVSRSGTGNYAVSVAGNAVLPDSSFATIYRLAGNGTVGVNFGTGEMTLQGLLRMPARATGLADINGVWSGTGLLASNANSLSGTLMFDFGATGKFNGNFAGRFFGPAAQEIGLSFSATGSTGSLSGTVMGRSN